MTIGSQYKNLLYNYTFTTPWGTVPLSRGRVFTKSWSGSDAKPSLQSITAGSPKFYTEVNSKSGKKRWWKRVMPVNGYTCDITRQGPATGYAIKNSGSGDAPYAIGSTAVNPQHCPIDPSHDWKAISKLRNRLYGSGFHPAIFFAEMPKALNTIASAAERLHWCIWAMRHRNLKVFLSNLGGLSDSQTRRIKSAYGKWQAGKLSMSGFWLEAYYGWKPLISDMESGAQYLAHALNAPNDQPARISGKRNLVETRVDNPPNGGYGFTTAKTTGVIKYVCDQFAMTQTGKLPTLPSIAGAVWEVIPYSFVFDWAIPIASYLDALRTAEDISARVVKTTYLVTEFSDMRLGKGWKSGITWVDPTDFPSLRMISVKREVLPRITPSVPTVPTSIGSVFSCWQRAASAVALLAQRHALGKYEAGKYL